MVAKKKGADFVEVSCRYEFPRNSALPAYLRTLPPNISEDDNDNDDNDNDRRLPPILNQSTYPPCQSEMLLLLLLGQTNAVRHRRIRRGRMVHVRVTVAKSEEVLEPDVLLSSNNSDSSHRTPYNQIYNRLVSTKF
jgi:hypothetical protein